MGNDLKLRVLPDEVDGDTTHSEYAHPCVKVLTTELQLHRLGSPAGFVYEHGGPNRSFGGILDQLIRCLLPEGDHKGVVELVVASQAMAAADEEVDEPPDYLTVELGDEGALPELDATGGDVLLGAGHNPALSEALESLIDLLVSGCPESEVWKDIELD